MLTFRPVEPRQTEGFSLQSITIYVRDHKHRKFPVGERSLELHYESFVLSQACRGEDEAKRLALDMLYGRAPRETQIAGREARVYELGPEPELGVIDPRSPAVVVSYDAEMFLLIASGELPSDALVRIAESLY